MRFVPSRHSKLILGRRVPFDGPLTCEDVHALTPGAYKCGAVFGIRIEVAGTSLYHQGSADLDDAAARSSPVDVFLAGVTGRQVTPRYWERILPRLDPRLLVPTHYDDFFAPLEQPLKLVRRRRNRRPAGRGAARSAGMRRSPPMRLTSSRAASGHSGYVNEKPAVEQPAGHDAAALEHQLGLRAHEERAQPRASSASRAARPRRRRPSAARA